MKFINYSNQLLNYLVFNFCVGFPSRVLQNNQIYYVSQEAFHPLQSLRQLDLRNNSYKKLPSSILFLPSLEKLVVDGSRECESCELTFASNCSSDTRRKPRQIPSFGSVTGVCLNISCVYYPSLSRTSSPVEKSDASSTQYAVISITQDNISYHNNTKASLTSASLVGNIALKTFLFVLGILAVLVNLVTITIVFTTPQLARISTMFLAGHIAVCDFLVGLSLLVTAVLAFDNEQRRFIDYVCPYVCPVMISFRSAALIVEPLVLFVMTLDRYKRIVNYSKPPLSRHFISIAAYFSWFTAVVVVSVGSVGFIDKVKYGTLCSRGDSSRKSIDFYIEKTLIAVSSLLFVFCCVMYFRIYRVVKTQNRRMGTQTYVRVSKLIFALVFSTLVLWYVPAIAVGVFGGQKVSREVRQLAILIAFTTNSLVNPFLYVFREKRFRHEMFPLCNRRTGQRTANPNVDGKNVFRVYEIALANMEELQTSSNYYNHEVTSKEYSTSL